MKTKLAIRIREENPGHHLWNNNGTWWWNGWMIPLVLEAIKSSPSGDEIIKGETQ